MPGVEVEHLQLFSGVARKQLKFDLWYEDALAGKVIMFAVSLLCSGCKSSQFIAVLGGN